VLLIGIQNFAQLQEMEQVVLELIDSKHLPFVVVKMHQHTMLQLNTVSPVGIQNFVHLLEMVPLVLELFVMII